MKHTNIRFLVPLLLGLTSFITQGADLGPATDAATRNQIARGQYIAQLGDCIACHTAEKGSPMAGGLALETPNGKAVFHQYHARSANGHR
jgi:mono/diheme cytochrome c family protein